MEHITIITDLATVSVAAGLAAVVFHLLRLPLLLGYLLCGLLLGPHLFSVFPIHNEETIRELSELGVIFLMFYIGLEFDLNKLKRILPSAILAVSLQCVSLIYLGILIAPLLGWPSINGLFLGGVLAISSTMITMPILTKQNAVKRNYGQIAIGILILEDIIAILMLVILSGVGLTGHFEWDALWQVTFLVGVFVVMVFFLGRIISPYLIQLIKKSNNPEVLTLVVVGTVLGIGELSERFHFSAELGAFLAGAILSQSQLSHAIEEAIEPMRNLFTAIFFVTVGMLIDPVLLVAHWKWITLITLLLVSIKATTCWIGLFLTGTKSDTGFRAALCKSHIGEFSFVIAGLGKSLGVTDDSFMTIAVGVSLGTIIIVPFMSDKADPIYGFLSKRMPKVLNEAGRFYQTLLRSIKDNINRNALLTLIKRPILQIVVYFLIFHGIILVASFSTGYVLEVDFLKDFTIASQVSIWVVTAIVCIPFLFAVIRNVNTVLMMLTEAAFSRRDSTRLFKGSMRNVFNTLVLSTVVLLFSASYLSAIASHLPTGLALIIFFGLIAFLGFFFWRQIIQVNSRIEYLFVESFNQKAKTQEELRHKEDLEQISKKYPWPIHMQEVQIAQTSKFCGKRICDLDIRAKSGASVIALSRNNYTYYDPSPMSPIFPQDKLILLGNKTQVQSAEGLINQEYEAGEAPEKRGFTVKKLLIGSSSLLLGETLAQANLRKRYGLNIIGIQRAETRITNPTADETFQDKDVLVVVASPSAIDRFEKELSGQ